jgi:hypothetical protein
MHMTIQIWSPINFGQKIPQFRFILKTSLFSVWVPNSKERKANPKKLYLGVLGRIAESLCLRISAYVCEVRIGLGLREWIRVDYITYY